jgi:hypothetical protein
MEAPVVYLYDRRTGDKPEREVSLEGVSDFKSFRQQILDFVAIHDGSAFVITNSSRQEINDDTSYEELVVPGTTLYLLESTDQELVAPTDERIDYVPHYDTLVKSGIYEYYASEGQNPLRKEMGLASLPVLSISVSPSTCLPACLAWQLKCS